MGARIISFFVFLSLVAFVLSLTQYKKYFTPEENLSQEQLQKSAQIYLDQKNATTTVAEAAPAAEQDSQAMDPNDPVIKQGELVYKEKGKCIDCHGANGEGWLGEEAPLIAGQHDWYVIDQVTQMKAGKRVNEKMNAFLALIDEKDIVAVAKYIKYLRVKE